MTLVDSSVWVDFFRRPGDPANEPLRQLVRAEQAAMTPPIAMELLMGPIDELAARRVRRVVDGTPSVALDPDLDFHAAADIFRAVRRSGRTVRSKVDCLIAAIAIRHQVPLLHKDADFEVIAAVTDLRHQSLR